MNNLKKKAFHSAELWYMFHVTAGRFLCYTSLVSKWGLDNLWQSRGILTPA